MFSKLFVCAAAVSIVASASAFANDKKLQVTSFTDLKWQDVQVTFFPAEPAAKAMLKF
jgi:hypothetical protein